jgi:hypothetical protein
MKGAAPAPHNLVLPHACFPVTKEVSLAIVSINEGVAAEKRGNYDLALQKYTKGVTMLTNALEGETDAMKAHQIRTKLPPFIERANQIGLTPQHHRPAHSKDFYKLALCNHETKVQTVASVIGMYPTATAQPYARVTRPTLEDAAQHDRALKEEYDDYRAFIDNCYKPHMCPSSRLAWNAQKGMLVKTAHSIQEANPFAGNIELPKPPREMISSIQNSVAQTRQKVEEMWVSALANSNSMHTG